MTINDHGKTFESDREVPTREGGKGKVSVTQWATYFKWSILALIIIPVAPTFPAAGIIHSMLPGLF